ncbi:MAG: DUF2207 domain-containing protein [Nitrospirota bacterium]|nr:DUF2207 domain-containing protein [Nitrospirota bacterium]
MIRIPFFLLLGVSAILVFLPSAACGADFTINNFSASILVRQDSSVTVKETLTVEFHRPRHGIYREIPFNYTDSLGRKIKTPVEVLSVEDANGGKLRAKIINKGNVVHIRIGDPDSYVSGLQKYEIFYKVENAVLFLDDHDELYWNVTGNYWQAEIRQARCTVSLEGEQTKALLTACYTGRLGSSEKACTYGAINNTVEFEAGRSLFPGEGLTIAYGWDKGLVSPPSSFKRFLWFINLEQNWIFILPVASLIIMISLWYRRGRDPRVRESVTVMYGPPKFNNAPLSPAEVGTLVDETLDSRDITATIVGLAVKGYIKIEETKEEGLIFDSKDYYLAKRKDADESLSLFERELMSGLFGSLRGRMVSDLKNKFYTHIAPLKKTIYTELTRMKFFTVSPDKVRQLYAGAGLITAIAATILISLLFSDSIGGTRSFLAGILSGLPMLGFSKLMPAKTKSGSAAYMEILGFEEFLSRAEKDQLVRMKDDNLFSKFFPYALALNVADNWARAFEGIYQQPPEWYVSPAGVRTFSPMSFNRSIGSAMSSLSGAMFSAPRSSGAGGGGGGFSGGGFGGGGGGSW